MNGPLSNRMRGVTAGVDIIFQIFDIESIETAQTIVDAIGAWPRGILGFFTG